MDGIYRMLGQEREAELERVGVRPATGSIERRSAVEKARPVALWWHWLEVRRPLSTAVAGVVTAAALFAGGYWVGISNAAEPPPASAAVSPFPDWFLPIWDAYDRNPAITPDFDFASLYSTSIGPAESERRS
jgi:hypothetical protein